MTMAKEEAERLMIAGGEDKHLRLRYDSIEPMPDFVALANKEGFDFTADELKQMLKENGDDFASSGNPRKRDIWWY
jgi:hypothetical protein